MRRSLLSGLYKLMLYGQNLSWQTYLAWGWTAIWQSKQWARGLNFQPLIAEQGLIFLFPLAILGWGQYRHHPKFSASWDLYACPMDEHDLYLHLFWGATEPPFHSGGVIFPFMGRAGLRTRLPHRSYRSPSPLLESRAGENRIEWGLGW